MVRGAISIPPYALPIKFSYYIVLFTVIGFCLYPCIAVFLTGASPMLLVHAAVRFAMFAAIVYALFRIGVFRWFSAHTWPLSGLAKQLNLSRFCRVLALNYGRLSFHESWTRATESVWDKRAQRHLMRVPDRVREGATLGQAIVECPVLPDMVKQMIVTAEKTGNADECFGKASEYLRNEAMHRAHVLSLSIGTAIIIAGVVLQALGAGFALGKVIFW